VHSEGFQLARIHRSGMDSAISPSVLAAEWYAYHVFALIGVAGMGIAAKPPQAV